MKHLSKVLALLLAVMMLASVLVACGDSKDESKSSDDSKADTSSQADGGDESEPDAPAGDAQTWGNITVNVPDDMKLTGGSLIEEDDENSLRLNDQDESKYFNYINVYVVETEDEAKSSIEMTKDVNSEDNPVDVEYAGSTADWKGIEYDSLGYHCVNVYGVVEGKVFHIMSCGYNLEDGTNLSSVLNSLK